jgi:hypothetical protein
MADLPSHSPVLAARGVRVARAVARAAAQSARRIATVGRTIHLLGLLRKRLWRRFPADEVQLRQLLPSARAAPTRDA